MHTNKTLKQLAYGHATAKVMSSTGNHQGCWYESFQFLTENANHPSNLEDWFPIKTYEDYSWSELLELIDSEALVIFDAMKNALELAKQGLVLAATSQPLKNVFNGLDMQQMVTAGSA